MKKHSICGKLFAALAPNLNNRLAVYFPDECQKTRVEIENEISKSFNKWING